MEVNITQEEIISRVETAAKQANAYTFIMTFPLKFQQDVGGNGIALSGVRQIL